MRRNIPSTTTFLAGLDATRGVPPSSLFMGGVPGESVGRDGALLDASLTPNRSLPDEGIDDILWTARYRLVKELGKGGQGVVYLAHRDGADGYEAKVAVKLYFRDSTRALDHYFREMRRVARRGQRISEIQNDNLLTIRDFLAVGDTRVMVMEWIDGVDIGQLLRHEPFQSLERILSKDLWERLNDVVVTLGPDQCRLKPGIAVAIVRGCLAGLSDLHHRGIVHCDLKPSNIMIKRTGTEKIIDVDSSCNPSEEDEAMWRGTPYYMAPETLERGEVTSASDVASLGYVLLEMLTGTQLFSLAESPDDLLAAKRALPDRLESLLPAEAVRAADLLGLCQKMIAVDPAERFADADEADLDESLGAAGFLRGLIKGNIATEYDRELAGWIDATSPSSSAHPYSGSERV